MDLLMDMAVLAAAQYSLDHLRPARLLALWALLRVCTLMAAALGDGFAACMHLPLLLLCAGAIGAEGRLAGIAQAAMCLLCFCAAAAGFYLLGGSIAAVAGLVLLSCLVRRSRNICCRWNIRVEAVKNGVPARFDALIDTGNRLREHGSGLPVLIVEEAAAGELAVLAGSLDARQKRSLPYGVLGGSGEISCFRCDEMYFSAQGLNRIEAPPCWLAIYPGRIPGGTCALAPPEFARAAAQAGFGMGLREFGRRSLYGLFKCKAIHLRHGGADSQGLGLLHRRQ